MNESEPNESNESGRSFQPFSIGEGPSATTLKPVRKVIEVNSSTDIEHQLPVVEVNPQLTIDNSSELDVINRSSSNNVSSASIVDIDRDQSIFTLVNHSVPSGPNNTTTKNGFFSQSYVKVSFIVGGSLISGTVLIVIAIFFIRKEKAKRARLEIARNRHSMLWRSSGLISPSSDDSVRNSFHSINMYGLTDEDENVYEYLTPLTALRVENPSDLNFYDPVSQSTFF